MDKMLRLNQKVQTPLGEGLIDCLPYNDETKVYGVWLDQPYLHNGMQLQLVMFDEKDLTAR